MARQPLRAARRRRDGAGHDQRRTEDEGQDEADHDQRDLGGGEAEPPEGMALGAPRQPEDAGSCGTHEGGVDPEAAEQRVPAQALPAHEPYEEPGREERRQGAERR
jgi:hypothetical protein